MSEDYPARLYAAVHDGNPGDVEFYRRRCAGARAVLELGCGDARVLASLGGAGRGAGRAVGGPALVGLDVDPQQLELARARADGLELELELELIMGDMRTLGAGALKGRRFDRVLIPHGGLYCLLDAADLDATLRAVAGSLTDDGLLILDAWAADAFHAEAEPDDQDPSWLEHVKVIELDGERWEVLERSSWDKATQRIDATYVHVRVGAEDAVEGLLRQRYVLAEQLRAALGDAGLELVELAGDFGGGSYDADAGLMVVVARRSRDPEPGLWSTIGT